MMRFDLISVFPEWAQTLCQWGVVGRALRENQAELHCWDLTEFGIGKHKQIDDSPYGGGPGMVLKVEPLVAALEAVHKSSQRDTPATVFTAHGQILTQPLVEELAEIDHLILVAGRYQGIDQRFIDEYACRQISLGDFIVSNGDLPAMVTIDAIVRTLPSVLGNDDSRTDESFTQIQTETGESVRQLSAPQYTKPAQFRNLSVPDVLISGNHEKILQWRSEMSRYVTKSNRPNLISGEYPHK